MLSGTGLIFGWTWEKSGVGFNDPCVTIPTQSILWLRDSMTLKSKPHSECVTQMQNLTLASFQETIIKLGVDVKLTTFHWVFNTEPLLNICAILLDDLRSRVVYYALGLICNYFLSQDLFRTVGSRCIHRGTYSTRNWEKVCISSYWTRNTTPCQRKAMPSVTRKKLLITNPTTCPAGFDFLHCHNLLLDWTATTCCHVNPCYNSDTHMYQLLVGKSCLEAIKVFR